jgi:Cu-Zn family superoxide dismutase
MKHASKVVPVLVALVATGGLASCGGGDDNGYGGNGDGNEAVSGQFERVAGAPSGYEAVAGEATVERSGGGTTASLRLSGLEPDTEYVAHLHAGGCDQADPGGPHFKFDPQGSDEPPNEIHFVFSSNGQGNGTARASSNREVPLGEAGSIVLHQAEAEGEDEHSSEHSAAGYSPEGEAVLVHAGHHHEDEPSPPEKIACAELEGGGAGDASASVPGDDPESASMGGRVPTVIVRGGEPVGGIQELEYDAGEQIRFEVSSDVADEVHVHGYDLSQDVEAGRTVSFDFPAEIEGIFEIELEARGTQIAELRVNP